jgi:exodeoxyribonuclease-3
VPVSAERQSAAGPKFDYKLKWFSRLTAHAKKLLAQKVPLVLAGDFNVAPTEQDIYDTTSWDDDALIQPQSRAAYRKLVDLGFTDALRKLHPKEPMYTFWHYMRKAMGARRGAPPRSSPHFTRAQAPPR